MLNPKRRLLQKLDRAVADHTEAEEDRDWVRAERAERRIVFLERLIVDSAPPYSGRSS